MPTVADCHFKQLDQGERPTTKDSEESVTNTVFPIRTKQSDTKSSSPSNSVSDNPESTIN